MVKGYKPITHDAHSESAFRTLPVSEKPSMGKPLYDLFAINSNGISPSNAGFDAERYIHQKVREYTLRSAAHWSSVQDTLPQHAAKLQHDKREEDERVLLLSVASAFDAASMQSLGLHELPKALRAFALVHLLRNSSVAAEDLIRDGASAGMAVNALHPAVVHQSSANKVQAEHSTKHRTTGASSDKVVSFESSSLGLIQGLLLVLGVEAGAATQKSRVSAGYMLKRMSEVRGKYDARLDLTAPCSSKVSRAQGASSLCERCFGTAPIWYQQSMENGPPG